MPARVHIGGLQEVSNLCWSKSMFTVGWATSDAEYESYVFLFFFFVFLINHYFTMLTYGPPDELTALAWVRVHS